MREVSSVSTVIHSVVQIAHRPLRRGEAEEGVEEAAQVPGVLHHEELATKHGKVPLQPRLVAPHAVVDAPRGGVGVVGRPGRALELCLYVCRQGM
jgi:hypothetical protein